MDTGREKLMAILPDFGSHPFDGFLKRACTENMAMFDRAVVECFFLLEKARHRKDLV